MNPKRTRSSVADPSLPIQGINITWMIPESDCWVQVGSEEASTEVMYVKAIIKNRAQNGQNTVELKNIQFTDQLSFQKVRIDTIHQVNRLQKEGYSDMVQMDQLNEAEIVMNLLYRYEQDLIYTFIGPTLIVMNPYKKIAGMLDNNVLQEYTSNAKKGSIDYREIPPHTYAIAAQSYCKLFERGKNQAIVISGESGAGKTENAKISMQFLTGLSGQKSDKHNGLESIENRILGCNPILEAFGNAKTVRNDNSSRFGKFVQIQVNKQNKKIEGATITNYLLEKSRVTTVANGERNYHIFYHILFGANKQLLKYLGLESYSPDQFQFLKGSGCYKVPTIDDNALFEEIEQAFKVMGISSDEKDTIYRILAGILLIGNVEFDSSTLTDSNPCKVKNEALFNKVAELLKVKADNLIKSINTVTRKIGSSIIQSPKKLDETISSRDSVARNLYDRLFSWIVIRLNNAINNKKDSGNSGSQEEGLSSFGIGLLDIFGFEVFIENSFEQFCINYTNEKLQQLYIQYVFKSEEQEFVNEGLSQYINQLGYKDNQAVIEIFDKPPFGIFHLIDESSSLASSTDTKLYDSIAKQHKSQSEIITFASKAGKMLFTVTHSAKPVDYCIDGFREKNKAEVSLDLTMTIVQSQDELLSSIFLGVVSQNLSVQEKSEIATQNQGKNSKENKFLGCKFRAQMKQLMDILVSADCHFIRCIKPNEAKRSSYFLQGYVLIQIKYLGVLQAILARKQGFPYRKDFKLLYKQFSEMTDKYRSLQLSVIEKEKRDLKSICLDLLKITLKDRVTNEVLFGKTKIFAKDESGKILDEQMYKWYEMKRKFAEKIINQFKKHLMRNKIKNGIARIQKAMKCFIKIQATYKMKKQKKRYLNIVQASNRIFAAKLRHFKKQYFSQYKLKVKAAVIAAATKNAQSTKDSTYSDNNSRRHSGVLNYQTVEKVENYATISNYNTFNAANNSHIISEISRDALSGYTSVSKEDRSAKMKAEYDLIQQKNKEIIDEGFEDDSYPKMKITSKLEKYMDLTFPTPQKAPPLRPSEDRFLNFSSSNQTIIEQIKNSSFQTFCLNVYPIRKKGLGEHYTMVERMSYEKRSLTKPLTELPKHHEPAAIKAFDYMLKYAGDKKHEDPHTRVIAYKLLRHILNQDDQEVTDEIFLQVLKQLYNNASPTILKYFQLGGLISSTITLSNKISLYCMNFFYTEAIKYESMKENKYEQWCKYILLRIGNNIVSNGINDWESYKFKREEIPLREEFSAVENMRTVWQPVYIYHNQVAYFKMESYTKIGNLIGTIGLEMEVMVENSNWYGIVEYLSIGDSTKTEIIDFGIRVLDWRAKRQRHKQEYLQLNPGVKYESRLYYQTVILNSIESSNIDTTLMMYSTYVNEYIFGIYFFDYSGNITEIDFIVEIAAIKLIADYKEYSKENLIMTNYVPVNKIQMLNIEVWKVKIHEKAQDLLRILTSQRRARSYFLEKFQLYQGKYFLTQKFYIWYSSIENVNENQVNQVLPRPPPPVQAVCLSKIGAIYILTQPQNHEIQSITLREIKEFSLNLQTFTFNIHTSQHVHSMATSNALNLYYNIDFYIKQVSDLEQQHHQSSDALMYKSTPSQSETSLEEEQQLTPKKKSTQNSLNFTDQKLIQRQDEEVSVKSPKMNGGGGKKPKQQDLGETDRSINLFENLL